MPSTVIRRYIFAPERRELFVEFTTGRCYIYSGVEPEAAERLRAAFVKGRHFNTHIRDQYACRRVDCEEPDEAVNAPVSGFP